MQRQESKTFLEEKEAQFLNVDLEVYSRSNLEPLVAALGNKVIPLYVGRQRGQNSVHLEVAAITKGADQTIRHFARLIAKLPKSSKKIWNAAARRDFNIGLRAAHNKKVFELVVSATTVRMISDLNGRIVVTVYGSDIREMGETAAPKDEASFSRRRQAGRKAAIGRKRP